MAVLRPWEGVCGRAKKFLAPPYYSQRAVFASPLSAFFITFTFDLYMRSRITFVVGFLPANFQLPMPFCSQPRVRHGRDKIDNSHQSNPLAPPYEDGDIITSGAFSWYSDNVVHNIKLQFPDITLNFSRNNTNTKTIPQASYNLNSNDAKNAFFCTNILKLLILRLFGTTIRIWPNNANSLFGTVAIYTEPYVITQLNFQIQ